MVGDTVENFVLKDQNDNDFNLYENLDKLVLLVFYPKDNSPVCTKQLTNYNLNKTKFEEHGIEVIGINPESYESHTSFCNSIGSNLKILSDSKKEIVKRFEALNFLGITKRKLVLIGKNKKILYEKSTPSFLYVSSEKIINSLRDMNII
jgi:thioredoxin-dependent peroxiredoxin